MNGMNYAVVIERGAGAFGAYVPDLPGCVAVGETSEDAQARIQEAIAVHVAGLKATGQGVPEPTTKVGYIEVTA